MKGMRVLAMVMASAVIRNCVIQSAAKNSSARSSNRRFMSSITSPTTATPTGLGLPDPESIPPTTKMNSASTAKGR